MAPALAPAEIGRDLAACGLLGAVLGAVRALLPCKGRAALLPDVVWVGALLLELQAYAAALSVGGVLRWYQAAAAFGCSFAVQQLLAGPLHAVEQGLLRALCLPWRWLLRALCLPWRWLLRRTAPARQRHKTRKMRARAARAEKTTAKKQKKNLPRPQRLLYNSNVSK